MNSPLQKRLAACLVLLLLGSLRVGAQYYRTTVEEPRWLTLRLDQTAVGVLAEAYEESTTVEGSGTSRQTRWFLGPLLGLTASGSVYHPNLFSYGLNLDGSLGWMEDKFSGAGSSSSGQLRFLGAAVGTARILDNKPLHGSLYGGYAHTYQDYDFFNRIYINRWRYGGALTYSTGPLTLTGSAYQETQDATGYGVPMNSENLTVSGDVTHRRASGSSSVGASWIRTAGNYYGDLSNGDDYTLSASDAEDFGSRKQFHSLVNLGLNHLEYAAVPTDLYTAMGDLRAEHTDRLSSQYTLNYSRNTSGEAMTDNLSGNASLRHRLYDSLTSDLTLQGFRYTAANGPDRQDSWQFGGGPGFNYIKKLSASTTLTAYETLALLHTEVESSGGVIPVIDEQHFFGAGGNGAPPGSFYLRQPYVIRSSILITDSAHQPPGGFIQGLDYVVIVNGQMTLIQRLTGSHMPDTVLVSYNFDASPSGSYDTLNNACGVRLDFFDHHWSVYGRLNINQNYGSGNLTVQNLQDWVIGTEGNWRFIRAGAELEIYDSNLSPFNALRFFQSFTFRPGDNSSLSLNFNETFLHYVQAARDEQNYTAILRYNQSLGRHWGLVLELGGSQRVGPGVDQTLAVFRPQVQYTAGKLSATIGYDFGYDEYLGTQTRVRNMGFVRIRKEF